MYTNSPKFCVHVHNFYCICTKNSVHHSDYVHGGHNENMYIFLCTRTLFCIDFEYFCVHVHKKSVHISVHQDNLLFCTFSAQSPICTLFLCTCTQKYLNSIQKSVHVHKLLYIWVYTPNLYSFCTQEMKTNLEFWRSNTFWIPKPPEMYIVLFFNDAYIYYDFLYNLW